MKYLLLLVFTIFFFQKVFPQNTFELIVNKDNTQRNTSIIVDNEDNYIALSVENDYFKPLIIKINSYGKVIDSLFLDEEYTAFDLISVGDNRIIVTGGKISGEIEDTYLWVMEIDNDLNIIWEKIILKGHKLQRINAKINSKGNLILYGGVTKPDGNYGLSLLEITLNGELLKTLIYGNETIPILVFDFLEKKDSSGYYTFQFHDSCILDIDTNFSIKSKRRYLPAFSDGLHMFSNSNNTLWLTDSTYLLSGLKANDKFDLSLIIADTNHYFLFQYYYETQNYDMVAFWDNLSFIEKDNIYFLGTLNSSFDPYETTPNQMILFNFNDTLGLNWQKTIGGDAYYNATNIIATQDGGCLIAATRSDASNYHDYDMYFLKLDSLGNITHINGTPQKISDFAVYPNPATNFINIKKGVQIEQAEFVLYNSAGQIVLQSALNEDITSLNISNLQIGVYIYNILENGQVVDRGETIVQ